MAADDPKQTLTSIAAGMVARAAAETKATPKGIVGGVIESITGQVKEYNSVIEENTKLRAEQSKTELRLLEIIKEVAKIEEMQNGELFETKEAAKEAALALKKLKKEQEGLTKAQKEGNEKLSISNAKMQEATKTSGWKANAVTMLIGKVAGLTGAYFSFKSMLESVDKRLKLSATQVAEMGDVTGSYFDNLGKIKDATLEWNKVVNESNMTNAKYGIGVEETGQIIENLSKNLRVATEDQKDLAKMTGQMTQDIGFMSKLLRVNTDELANATVEASKKFGKSTQDMSNELAGMYSSLQDIKMGSQDTVVNLGDLTRQVLEGQASFQGYNLNLRETARVMGSVAAKAQEQGATYEMSMKAAKGLTDIIAGGTAPDWAKYMAGNKMLDEIKNLKNKATKEGRDIADVMAEQFKIDPSTKAGQTQLKGLENLSKNYKKYGNLSASYMAEELLRGTETSNEQMFDLLKKYGTGHEGRELLKRVWGLDDAAATAATLALDTAETYDQMVAIKGKATAEAESRKPPTIKDLKDQTESYVEAVGQAEAGIQQGLKNVVDALMDNPLLNAILGAVSGGSSLMLQLLQTGLGQKAAGALPGVLKAAPGAALGAVKGIPLALAAAKGGASIAGSAAAAGGGAAGVGAVALPVAAAGAAGLAAGYGLRKLSDAVEDATDGMIPSIDTVTQKMMDLHTEGLYRLTGGLIDLRAEIDDETAMRRSLNGSLKDNTALQGLIGEAQKHALGQLEEGSLGMVKAMEFYKDFKPEQLEGFAKEMEEKGGVEYEKALASLTDLAKRGKEEIGYQGKAFGGPEAIAAFKTAAKRAEEQGQKLTVQQWKGMGTEERAALTGPAEATATAVAEKAKKKKEEGPPPVVTVNRLTARQKEAVSMQVAEQLAPEIKSTAATLFEKMTEQSVSYYEQLTSVTNVFWQDTLPETAKVAWDSVVASFDKKLKDVMGAPMMPLDMGGGAEAGGGGMGGVSAGVGPDGSIQIRLMIPRNALDKSNRQSAGYVE